MKSVSPTLLGWIAFVVIVVAALATQNLSGAPLLGLGAIIAALFGWLLRETSRRQDKRSERKEKRLRTLAALRAEIDLSAETLKLNFNPDAAPANRLTYCKQVLKAGPEEHSMPMAETFSDYYIFDHQRPNLADLPEFAIREVVRFYQSDRYVTELLEGFAEGHYEKMSPVRRLKAIDAYFRLGFAALDAALRARCALDAAHDGHDEPPADALDRCSPEDRLLIRKLEAVECFNPTPEELFARFKQEA